MALVIPYVSQVWTDGSSAASAARLTVIEAGVHEAHFQPAVRVTHNTTQSITSATITALAFNTERFDQAGNVADTMHDTVTNNTRLTCRYAGVYQITAQAAWASSPSTGVIYIRLNGTTDIAQSFVVANYAVMNITTLYSLAVNDYVECRVQQTSGGAINITSNANYSPEFMMCRVG